LFLTYQYGLRPKRQQYRRLEAIPRGIRSCALTKQGRAWRVALQIEVADVHTVRREANNLVVIDWGVERLATLSTGETIANPRFGAEAATGIRKAQHKLARARQGSRRRKKAVAHLARQRRKLANRRKTHLHQLTAAIAAASAASRSRSFR
jgi:putative transposase